MTTFVHIPRTGGLGLTEALKGSGIVAQGHRFKLSNVGEAITIVRDPVDRFISCYDHIKPDIPIEDMARDPDMGGWFFAPMTAWLDVDKPLLWVGHTETLASDFERLRDLLGLTADLPAGYNASRQHSTLSTEGRAAVRAWYADDYALMEALA